MRRHARTALFLLALVFAGSAQMISASSLTSRAAPERHQSSLTALGHRQDSAVVPANPLVRGGRAIRELSSVTLAGLLALVAMLAVWFTASVRRRARLSYAVVPFRRRGPPALLTVG